MTIELLTNSCKHTSVVLQAAEECQDCSFCLVACRGKHSPQTEAWRGCRRCIKRSQETRGPHKTTGGRWDTKDGGEAGPVPSSSRQSRQSCLDMNFCCLLLGVG